MQALSQRGLVAAPFRASRVVSWSLRDQEYNVIGCGAVGSVFLALWPASQAPVAVARRTVLVVKAAAEVEAVTVSDVTSKEAVAHLRNQRGSVHKVRGGHARKVQPTAHWQGSGMAGGSRDRLERGWLAAASVQATQLRQGRGQGGGPARRCPSRAAHCP